MHEFNRIEFLYSLEKARKYLILSRAFRKTLLGNLAVRFFELPNVKLMDF